jgi:hypothetical protein
VHGFDVLVPGGERPSHIQVVVDPAVRHWHRLQIDAVSDLQGGACIPKSGCDADAPELDLGRAEPAGGDAGGQVAIPRRLS